MYLHMVLCYFPKIAFGPLFIVGKGSMPEEIWKLLH